MLQYMLDISICIHVVRSYPPELRDRLTRLAEQLIALAQLLYSAEKSARRSDSLQAIEHFTARLEVLPFAEKAAAHYGQIRAQLERAGRPAGAYDMMIGGHARSEGLVLVTNNVREFEPMGGLRVANWV
jgi:tRNA(fMet)-specific endonuclease VapC